MRLLLAAFFLCACGGASGEWAGKWLSTNTPAGSAVEMTLTGSGTAISGMGVQHREAGTNTSFAVGGNTTTITFTFPDASTEAFRFGQPDNSHLVLTGSSRTIDFTRQP